MRLQKRSLEAGSSYCCYILLMIEVLGSLPQETVKLLGSLPEILALATKVPELLRCMRKAQIGFYEIEQINSETAAEMASMKEEIARLSTALASREEKEISMAKEMKQVQQQSRYLEIRYKRLERKILQNMSGIYEVPVDGGLAENQKGMDLATITSCPSTSSSFIYNDQSTEATQYDTNDVSREETPHPEALVVNPTASSVHDPFYLYPTLVIHEVWRILQTYLAQKTAWTTYTKWDIVANENHLVQCLEETRIAMASNTCNFLSLAFQRHNLEDPRFTEQDVLAVIQRWFPEPLDQVGLSADISTILGEYADMPWMIHFCGDEPF